MRFLNFAYVAAFSLTLVGNIFGSVDEVSGLEIKPDELLAEQKKRQNVVTMTELASRAVVKRLSPVRAPLESSELSTPKAPSRPHWLLSLEGGGIRCLMQLQILAEIERLTKKSIIEMFDVVAGTSFGGIFAALLTMPDPLNPGKPKYSPQDLFDIFSARKNEIFQSKWQSFDGRFKTRYKTTPYINLIKDLAGDNKFSDRLLPTLLVTYCLNTNEEHTFSSGKHEDFYTWAIAAAAGAAPTYFKPQRIYPIDCPSYHRGYVISDGSTCMNNPTMIGLNLMHEARMIAQDDLNVLSLGAGESGTHQLNSNLLGGGIYSWGDSMAKICISGQESYSNKMAELYCKERYHRLNPILNQNNMAFDDITGKSQDTLFAAAYQCVRDNCSQVTEVINSLVKSANNKAYAKNLNKKSSAGKHRRVCSYCPVCWSLECSH